MSDFDPTDPDDDQPDEFDLSALFGGGDPNALLQQLMGLFGGGFQGSGSGIDQATQIAVSIATGGTTEPNVDPLDRMKLEQLARVAELQVAQATGLRVSLRGPISIAPVTRSEWAKRSMHAYRDIFEALANAMTPIGLGDGPADPGFAMFEQLLASFRPMMMNLTTGSMVGHLGARALGTYDLPLPRPDSDELLVVVPSLDEFGDEWSLDADDLRMWIALSEVTHHAVVNLPHVAERLTGLLTRYASAFESSPDLLDDSLHDIELGPGADFAEVQRQIQQALGDPTEILGALRSAEQEALLPEIAAVTATIVGYVDHVMDELGTTLITDYTRLTEALRRRRVTASESDRFVDRLLGLELDQALYDRGRAFVDGVAERAGGDVLQKLWESAEALPTPNELEAPGLWLARMGIDFDLDVELGDIDAQIADAFGSDDTESDESGGDSEEE